MSRNPPTPEMLSQVYSLHGLLENAKLARELGHVNDAVLYEEAADVVYKQYRDEGYDLAWDMHNKSGPGWEKYQNRLEALKKSDAGGDAWSLLKMPSAAKPHSN